MCVCVRACVRACVSVCVLLISNMCDIIEIIDVKVTVWYNGAKGT